jgi:hypothetical protein
LEALGALNTSGNIVTNHAGALTFERSVGSILASGINYSVDPTNPHIKSTTAIDTSGSDTFIYSMQNGDSNAGHSTINPDVRDDGTNYPAATVSNNKWTNQRVFSTIGGVTLIQPGQNEYSSRELAVSSIQSETFTYNSAISNALHTVQIAVITVQKGASNLDDAVITTIGKFGSASASGEAAVTTLQAAYNKSGATPIITTTTAGDKIVLQRGSAADTDTVLEVQNGAGSAQFTVAGESISLAADSVSIPNSDVTTYPTASSDSTGVLGEIRWDTNYLYIKVATTGDQWKRAALSTFS